jgi:hypothetical protein
MASGHHGLMPLLGSPISDALPQSDHAGLVKSLIQATSGNGLGLLSAR